MSRSSQPALARQNGSVLIALVVGAILAACVLGVIHYGPFRHSIVYRYVEHPVQWAEVVFFCCGLGALLAKFLQLRCEHTAFEEDILPRWDGKPVSVDRAGELLASIERQPGRIQGTFLGQRIRAIVEFLCQRRSASELDDHLRTLADNDAIAQENSFALVRFITWAIPILGFLGTVIGITGAIAGVTPEVLEESLSMVTDGLAEAFDSTALALGLTMVLMFITFLVERQEQSLLERIDRLVEGQLGHRFLRDAADTAPFLDIVRQSTQSMTMAIEGLVQKQAEVLTDVLHGPERQTASLIQQLQQQMVEALGQALDQTIEAYAQRLAALEQQALQQSAQVLQQMADVANVVREVGQQQQQSLEHVAEVIASQACALAKLHDDATQVTYLQSTLQQNLTALADTGAFEEALHSLTAAVHLLTARVGGSTPRLSRDKAA